MKHRNCVKCLATNVTGMLALVSVTVMVAGCASGRDSHRGDSARRETRTSQQQSMQTRATPRDNAVRQTRADAGQVAADGNKAKRDAEMALAAKVLPSKAGQTIEAKSGRIKVERLATLEHGWGLAYLPDGRLLVTEKPGRLRFFADGKLSEPISGVPEVVYKGQGGLLDVAVDPNFASNKFVYVSYAEKAAQQPDVKQDERDPRLGPEQDLSDVVLRGAAVARGRLEGNQLQDVKVIWRQEPKQIGRGHYGGTLVFAPDGTLFILSGERQRFTPAQEMNSNLGKVVRINTDGTIPSDNPFASRTDVRSDIWSSGHRNPLGGAIHPATGKLWIHEMGPAQGDELNMPEPGKNYGWPVVSNGDNYDGSPIPDHPTQPQFAPPVFYWHPAISPAGFIFYTGDMFANWKNDALIGGLSSEVLIRVTIDGDRVRSEERLNLQARIREIVQAPDGSVLVITDPKEANGELLRLTPER